MVSTSSWSLAEEEQPGSYEAGKDYQRLNVEIVHHKSIQDLIAEDPKKIQVIEFFNYGCFWCGRMHAQMEEWIRHKPLNVKFYRFPLAFNKKWEVLAKAYYVTKALGKTETLDPEFFAAIHQRQIDLSDEKLLSKFFVEHGVSEQKFLALYHSFTVNKELMKANELADAYRISLSPVIIINAPSGCYLLTARMAGSEQALLKILDYLIVSEGKKLAGS